MISLMHVVIIIHVRVVVLYVITIIIIYRCGLRLNASGSQNQC